MTAQYTVQVQYSLVQLLGHVHNAIEKLGNFLKNKERRSFTLFS
jgi:hypothetical protein